jgi:hypothetical protein
MNEIIPINVFVRRGSTDGCSVLRPFCRYVVSIKKNLEASPRKDRRAKYTQLMHRTSIGI